VRSMILRAGAADLDECQAMHCHFSFEPRKFCEPKKLNWQRGSKVDSEILSSFGPFVTQIECVRGHSDGISVGSDSYQFETGRAT